MSSRTSSPVSVTLFVNVSALIFAIFTIAWCCFGRPKKTVGRSGQVAAQNEDDPAAMRITTRTFVEAARKEDLDAFQTAVDEDALFPHFKTAEMETAFLEYRFEHGFPRVQKKLETFFLPVSSGIVGTVAVFTDLINGASHFAERANTERRVALAIMLLLTVPFWIGLRFGVTRALVHGDNFHLYANTVVGSACLFILVTGAIYVYYGAYWATPHDWMLRAGITCLIQALPRIGEQSPLGATVTSVIVAFATEIVCYVALQGAAYSCPCYRTLSYSSIADLPIGFIHSVFWLCVIITACEL